MKPYLWNINGCIARSSSQLCKSDVKSGYIALFVQPISFSVTLISMSSRFSLFDFAKLP